MRCPWGNAIGGGGQGKNVAVSSGAGNWWTVGAAGLAKLGAAVLPRVRRSLRAAPAQGVGGSGAQPLAADLFSAFDMGAVILRTPEGAILHWSAGCERLFGFPASEALGRTTHE